MPVSFESAETAVMSGSIAATAPGEARRANIHHMPLDAASIAMTLLKEVADGLHVGPILMGTAKPAHILLPSSTSRGVANMLAVTSVEAQAG